MTIPYYMYVNVELGSEFEADDKEFENVRISHQSELSSTSNQNNQQPVSNQTPELKEKASGEEGSSGLGDSYFERTKELEIKVNKNTLSTPNILEAFKEGEDNSLIDDQQDDAPDEVPKSEHADELKINLTPTKDLDGTPHECKF